MTIDPISSNFENDENFQKELVSILPWHSYISNRYRTDANVSKEQIQSLERSIELTDQIAHDVLGQQAVIAAWPGLGKFLWGIGEVSVGVLLKLKGSPSGDMLIAQGWADMSGAIIENAEANSEARKSAAEEEKRKAKQLEE